MAGQEAPWWVAEMAALAKEHTELRLAKGYWDPKKRQQMDAILAYHDALKRIDDSWAKLPALKGHVEWCRQVSESDTPRNFDDEGSE